MEPVTLSGGIGFLVLMATFIVLEAFWLILRRKDSYPWQEAMASFSVAIIKRLIDAATAGVALGFLFWVYHFRWWTQEINSLWMGLLLFLLVELFYYWHHRWTHEIRWLWANHSVHHTPMHMNLSVAGSSGQ